MSLKALGRIKVWAQRFKREKIRI